MPSQPLRVLGEVLPPFGFHELARGVALEHVLEVGRVGVVDVEKCAMSTLLSTISRQCEPSISRVPRPLRPLVGADALDLRRAQLRSRRGALGVVPHQQLAVDLQRLPTCGCVPAWAPGGRRGSPRSARSHRSTASRGTGTPRCRPDGALRQVGAQVPAIPVEDVDVALGVGVDHQLSAEGLDAVRFAVPEILGQTQAMPAAGEARHRRTGVDLADLVHVAPFSLRSEQTAPGTNLSTCA